MAAPVRPPHRVQGDANYVLMAIHPQTSVEAFQQLCAQYPRFRIGDADRGGYTVMHSAAQNCNIAVMRYIYGLDRSLAQSAARRGGTPLHFAAQTNSYEAAAQLIEWGADVNRGRITPLLLAISREEKLTEEAAFERRLINEGYTIRGSAADNRVRNLALVRLLLQKGAVRPADGRGAALIGQAMAEEARAARALTDDLYGIPSLRQLPREVLAIAADHASDPGRGLPPQPELGVTILTAPRNLSK